MTEAPSEERHDPLACREAPVRRRRRPPLAPAALLAPLVGLAACDPAPAEPLGPGQMAFGVFGDGPYNPSQTGRFERVLADVAASDAAWLIHVGDILGSGCTDAAYRTRRAQLDAVPYAVVYTPGDNEWTDCHRDRPAADPLERLAGIRSVFFSNPERSLGGRPLPVASQSGDPAFAEFAENARWSRGGFLYASLHLVGSGNGLWPFDGRTADHDAEVERRTRAAVAWLDGAFAEAVRDSARGVVLAVHTNLWHDEGFEPRAGYGDFLDRLAAHVAAFPGPVLLVHGDTHYRRLDQPLVDSVGRTLGNFTRLETFGSPDIGWVRVVLDTTAGAIVRFEPRRMRGWW